MLLKTIAAVFTGYVLGSVNFAVLLSIMLKNSDVRGLGSGNAGATNMARTFGLGSGLGTMAGDMAKTALAMLLGKLLCGDAGMAAGGLGCLIGHCSPVFYSFRGGKGVAVGAIIILFASPSVFAAVIAVFLTLAFSTRKVSLASVSAAASGALLICFTDAPLCLKAAVIVTALIVGARHRQNLIRLLNGTEPDFVLPAKHRA